MPEIAPPPLQTHVVNGTVTSPLEQGLARLEGKARSCYLRDRLALTPDHNLYNHVKFSMVAQQIRRLGLSCPNVLDIGCGTGVAGRYLESLGIEARVFGTDYESSFLPDAVVDLLRFEPGTLAAQLPAVPDVILCLDVLEHLSEDPAVVSGAVRRLVSVAGPDTLLLFIQPQMYRLDRFKLAHLHYPEHKIRLTRPEWREVFRAGGVAVDSERGFGYLSVIPYLPMASKRYRPDNRLGRLFDTLRSDVMEFAAFKPVDLALSLALGSLGGPLTSAANGVLYVGRPVPSRLGS